MEESRFSAYDPFHQENIWTQSACLKEAQRGYQLRHFLVMQISLPIDHILHVPLWRKVNINSNSFRKRFANLTPRHFLD